MPRWIDAEAAARIARGGYGLALGGLLLWPWMCAYWRTGADIAVACILLGYLLRTAALGRWAEWRGPLWLAIGGLAAWAAISACFARNDPALLDAAGVWWAHKPFAFTLISGWWWLRFPIAFHAISTWLLNETRARRWMLGSASLLLALVMADAWTQLATGHGWSGQPMFSGQRLTGPLTHPNLGMLIAKIGLAVMGGAALWAMPMEGAAHHARKFGLWVAFMLSGASLVLLSGERMPALLLLAAFFAMALYLARRQPRWRRFVIPACLGLLGLSALLLMLSPFLLWRAALFLDQVHHLPLTEYGQLYRAAWLLWLDHPLTGIGLRHFDPLCPTLLAMGAINKCNAHPHNIPLEWLSEGGLPALAGYIALVIAASLPLLHALKHPRMEALLPTAALLGMWILCFFPFTATQSNFNGWAAGLTWVGYGIATAYLRARPGEFSAGKAEAAASGSSAGLRA